MKLDEKNDNLNCFMGIGEVSSKIQVETSEEVPVVEFELEINYRENIDYVFVKCFGENVNDIIDFLNKGRKIAVEGLLKYQRDIYIKAYNIWFLDNE